MTGTLADYWPVLAPVLPPQWDTPVNQQALVGVAERLAPIPRVGFECRLVDGAPRVDVQQCVRRDDGEPAVLLEHLYATGGAAAGESGLGRFCAAWADPGSPLHGEITEVFLEYDLDGSAVLPAAAAPSLFFTVGTRRVAERALSLLYPEPVLGAMAANLARCFDACPPGAFVGYLGAMLGRAARGVRVNVKGIAQDDLPPFLEVVRWPGPYDEVAAWVDWAFDRFDRVTICLDVAEEVLPPIGLECVLSEQPQSEPRWRAVLEELSDRGLCAAGNVEAFLRVPGQSVPPEMGAAWPAAWIAASLCGPTGRFSTTERRLSHVKLTVGNGPASLKGYWGAGHVWRERGPHPPARRRPPLDLEQAVAKAVDHLVARQAHTGRWSDFFVLPAGTSDEWVTAFVATCLLDTGAAAPAPRAAAGRAWRALLRRRPEGAGWGYNRLTPPDADSTAWVLRLAAALAVDDGQVGEGHRFLLDHVVAGGGVTTYARRDPILGYTRLPEDASFEGWQAAHACVTAAAAPVVGARAAAYLAAEQSEAGNWAGYWWWDDEYTTALAAESSPAGRDRAVAWAAGRVGADGAVTSTDGSPSPWATAWCVRLLRWGTTPEAHAARARAVRWLLATQLDDGGWPAAARMRVPVPGQLDPAGHPATINALDGHGLFTTAAVAAALSLSLSLSLSRSAP